MAEPVPGIDLANLPAPNEGILVTLFITVRKVARSRYFYSRVLGGTVVMDENPCIVKLSNSWIIMNPGDHPVRTSRISRSATTSPATRPQCS
jgi:hypothetical protein